MSDFTVDVQKRQALEGAPDPFPTLGSASIASISTSAAPAPSSDASAPSSSQAVGGPSSQPRQSRQPQQQAPVDTTSEAAFPALGGGGGGGGAAANGSTNGGSSATKVSAWSSGAIRKTPAIVGGAGGTGRHGAPSASSLPSSTSFSIPSSSITLSPKAFAELIRRVTDSQGCTVEASTQMRTGLKTFFLRGPDDARVAAAKRTIERGVSKVETKAVEVPVSTIGIIIGPKGATLRSITDATGCKIDMPKRDQLPKQEPIVGGEDDDEDDEDDEDRERTDPPVAISITGPSPAIADAQSRIMALIKDRISQTSVSIKDIPSEFYPFIAGPGGKRSKQIEAEVGKGQVQVHVPPPGVWKSLERQAEQQQQKLKEDEGTAQLPPAAGANGSGAAKKLGGRDLSIRVKGDKDAVTTVVAEIRRIYEDVRDNARTMSISIPKRQHRFLVGAAADEILEAHGCVIQLPPVEDPSDSVTIRGPQRSLAPALTTAMDKANAVAVETIDVVGCHRGAARDPLAHAKNILHYLLRTSRLRQIADSVGGGIKVFPPFNDYVESTGTVVIEVVGDDRAAVSDARERVLAAARAVTPSHVRAVEIDVALHRFLIGKKGAKIAGFESQHSVASVFPPADGESNTILLVSTVSDLPSDKKQREARLAEQLDAAERALQALAKEAADVKTEELAVEQKWHRHIIGPGGSVLRSLLGEDPLATVTVGKKDGKEAQDVVIVRGPSNEVDRLSAAIKQVVEEAKDDDALNGHTAEFSVDKKHVPHLVGASGSAINKIRESLGVRVNFDDAPNGKTVVCKIIGRKEAVAEAKSRLEAQVEKLADETTETIKIQKSLHAALIGQQGKYAIRLEDKYGVKITFPKDSAANGDEGKSSSQKPDEVIIRGGRKGVAGAKAELVEAADFERDSNQETTFKVPTSAVARILGKRGASINAIKAETGARIDVDKTSDEQTAISIKGDKKAIASAKSSILAIVSEMGDRAERTIEIENKYHRQLIGPGGQRLRELIARCGGPEDGARQAGMVNFPRSNDSTSDEVRVRGDKAVVDKIEAELQKIVDGLKNQVVLGVGVPVAAHAIRIGRGGAALADLARKTGATIQFPGSRQYASAGEIENASEVEGVPANELVKVIGTREACKQAIDVLSQPVPARSTAGRPRKEAKAAAESTEGSGATSEPMAAEARIDASS